MSKRKSDDQLQFKIPERGGKRRNAGRKKIHAGKQNHIKREPISKHTPVHITMKLRNGLGNLRSDRGVSMFARAAERAAELGLRIVKFSLQSNHLHLLCEADDSQTLETGLRSFTTSVAIAIRKMAQTTGKVFADRYHAHLLKTPTEVLNAINYVIFNHSHHCKTERSIDPYSSEAKQVPWVEKIKRAISEPRSWLLREGWRRGRS